MAIVILRVVSVRVVRHHEVYTGTCTRGAAYHCEDALGDCDNRNTSEADRGDRVQGPVERSQVPPSGGLVLHAVHDDPRFIGRVRAFNAEQVERTAEPVHENNDQGKNLEYSKARRRDVKARADVDPLDQPAEILADPRRPK